MTHQFHPIIEQRLADLGATGPRRDLPREVLNRSFGGDEVREPWDLQISDQQVPGPHGPVPVRVYRPSAPAPDGGRPALVWNHGGGFAWGDLEMPEAHEVSRGVAGRADAVVVSVDYRLCAPFGEGEPTRAGVTFPVPLDDVVAAFEWTLEHAGELGIDPARVAIGGASAGGALAAGAALRLADEGHRPWQALLMYPVTHPLLPEASSPATVEALDAMPASLLWPDQGRQMNENYLGGPLELATPYAFAGLATDLSHFPPTLIDVDEYDDLRRGGERFAEQLRADGVEVELVVSPGVPHGHLNWVGFPVTTASVDRLAERLRRLAD